MTTSWNMNTLTRLRDKDIYSSDGEKIGSVKDIYYDDTSGNPEWVGVGTGFLGMKERVVPVEQLTSQGERLLIPFTKDKIQNEPDFETEGDFIADQDEVRLCSYFGIGSHQTHRPRALRYGQEYRGTAF